MLEPPPLLVVVTGDLINGEEPEASTKLYKELFSKLNCPFFSVYGNHDNREQYQKILGRFNYAFDVLPYHFIVLDNIVDYTVDTSCADTYGGKFSERTIAWLKRHLQLLDKSMPLILFCHATIYREGSMSSKLPGDAHNYEPVLEMLEPYNVIAWFAGYCHTNNHNRKAGVDYFTTASLSDLRGAYGYGIVKVYPDQVEYTFRNIKDFVSP